MAIFLIMEDVYEENEDSNCVFEYLFETVVNQEQTKKCGLEKIYLLCSTTGRGRGVGSL